MGFVAARSDLGDPARGPHRPNNTLPQSMEAKVPRISDLQSSDFISVQRHCQPFLELDRILLLPKRS